MKDNRIAQLENKIALLEQKIESTQRESNIRLKALSMMCYAAIRNFCEQYHVECAELEEFRASME